MALEFKKATRAAVKLRMALMGPPGSGKTYSALRIASSLAPGGKIGLMDSEHDSALKYAPPRGLSGDPSQGTFDFVHMGLESYSPLTYVEGIDAANAAGLDVLVIDSISHAWMGKDGALEQVDRAAKRSQSNNKFTAWGDVTPMQNAFIESMLSCKCHLIVTLRSKVEHVLEKDANGKNTVRKVGMAPIQRDGVEFEFDVVGDMTSENNMIITKTRCSPLAGQIIQRPGPALAQILRSWLDGDANADVVAADIAKTTSGQALLKWTGAVNLARPTERASLLKLYIERWTSVVAAAKNEATLAAILGAIDGMPRPLCEEVAAGCTQAAAKRRAELTASMEKPGTN